MEVDGEKEEKGLDECTCPCLSPGRRRKKTSSGQNFFTSINGNFQIGQFTELRKRMGTASFTLGYFFQNNVFLVVAPL